MVQQVCSHQGIFAFGEHDFHLSCFLKKQDRAREYQSCRCMPSANSINCSPTSSRPNCTARRMGKQRSPSNPVSTMADTARVCRLPITSMLTVGVMPLHPVELGHRPPVHTNHITQGARPPLSKRPPDFSTGLPQNVFACVHIEADDVGRMFGQECLLEFS